MKIAWLKCWTYTHDSYIWMWSPWTYISQNSNLETINFLMENRAVWLLPKLNVYGGPVEEVMWNIWKVREAKMLWYFPLKINHVLASKWSLEEIKEVRAHPQALMQCSEWLRNLWADSNLLFNEAYKTPNLYETSKIILEVENIPWSLWKSLEVLSRNWINLQYLHSTPYWRNKFRFDILIDENDLSKIYSKVVLDELIAVWWKLYQNDFKYLQTNKIKLLKTKTNVDWIVDAKINPEIWVICSENVAIQNWLNILKNPFCPLDNETHFSVISTLREDNTESFKWIIHDKVIWLLTLPDTTWVLAKALKIIMDAWLSLNFIMSLANNIWWYDFPIVLDKTPDIIKVQNEIRKLSWNLRIL